MADKHTLVIPDEIWTELVEVAGQMESTPLDVVKEMLKLSLLIYYTERRETAKVFIRDNGDDQERRLLLFRRP